jgi:hypothetical protein
MTNANAAIPITLRMGFIIVAIPLEVVPSRSRPITQSAIMKPERSTDVVRSPPPGEISPEGELSTHA